MKWILILIYFGGLGTPVKNEVQTFEDREACKWAAIDFAKKHENVTAICDERKPSLPKETQHKPKE